MGVLAQLVAWINVVTNSLGELLLAPLMVLPGWLSNAIISAVAGVILLIIFKYTSNQRAIGRVRDAIKADMLALKLFKDSMAVTFEAQGRAFKGAFLLLVHAIRPMAVMILPVVLLLSQMGLWYQYRPLACGEEAVISMELRGDTERPWPDVTLELGGGGEVMTGPVRVFSKGEIYWKIKAGQEGYHGLIFAVDGQQFEKELAVGDEFMRVSVERPGQQWGHILLNPWEKPFGGDCVVQSVAINYPDRMSRTSGTDWWMVYFFVASLVFALMFKPFLKVRI